MLAGGLFLSVLSVNADNVQDKLNLDYFRSPEAAAFKKYGEESVNEYTGTADISVPLYTIKCKDIEIPLVLRYDASGIKVEQEASWVGLGWNLMVGGCINYVCAGDLDQKMDCSSISTKTWTEYLTTMHTYSGGRQYFHYGQDNIYKWMDSVPHSFAFDYPYTENLSQEMQNYLMWGYGERDFYSVNVLGKSFKFFIDPATLNYYIIGEAGEGYKIDFGQDPDDKKGIGQPVNIDKWTITDSNGYIYIFNNANKILSNDGKFEYNSSWYLAEIQSPLGEKVELSYTKPYKRTERERIIESYTYISNTVNNSDIQYASERGYKRYGHNGRVSNSYLKEIKTNNQIVTFSTTESKECSGMRLDSITVKPRNNKTVIKTIRFSYGSFEYDKNVGGNYAPAKDATAELRLKLNNVKEIASSETLTTSFEYNDNVKLPSKRSCAQDFWGYYNGQDNPSTSLAYGSEVSRHTMLPTPTSFMTSNYKAASNEIKNFKGANRNSDGNFMQAAMLTRIVYPTGGYTIYEYEPNSIVASDYKQSLEYEEFLKRPYDVNVLKTFSYTPSVPAGVNPVSNVPYNFTLKEELPFTLSVRCSGAGRDGQSFNVIIAGGTGQRVIPLTFKSSTDFKVVLQDKLPAGNYQLIIGAPTTGNDYGITCRLQGNYTSNTFFNLYPQKHFTRVVGGLRVKKISNYDNDKSLINYVTYNYNDVDGTTTGKLLDAMETIEGFNYKFINYEKLDGLNAQYMAQSPFVNSSHSISGWKITTGTSRFPAFYASCNPGIVGYSKVTKCKYNAKKNLEKTIVTSYNNHEPESLGFMCFYKCLDNGKMLSQETRDAKGKLILGIENNYRDYVYDEDNGDKWYSTNMVACDKIIIDKSVMYLDEREVEGRFQVWKYPYILSRVDLIKTTTTEYCTDGKQIVRTKEYKYKNNNENIQVSQIDENTSLSNQIQRTKITYSSDGTDAASRNMKSQHRLNDVVENKVVLVENGKEQGLSTQRTNYLGHSRKGTLYYLPNYSSTSIGNYAPEKRAIYTYDDSLNVSSIAVDGMETVYLWSYKGQYPIAKIEGLTYADVKAAIGETTINNLLGKATPTSTDISSIRTNIVAKGGYVTTYTYKPLVGMLSETQPNGNIIYYEYDSFGRLKNIKDYNKKIIKTYEYHYYDKK